MTILTALRGIEGKKHCLRCKRWFRQGVSEKRHVSPLRLAMPDCLLLPRTCPHSNRNSQCLLTHCYCCDAFSCEKPSRRLFWKRHSLKLCSLWSWDVGTGYIIKQEGSLFDGKAVQWVKSQAMFGSPVCMQATFPRYAIPLLGGDECFGDVSQMLLLLDLWLKLTPSLNSCTSVMPLSPFNFELYICKCAVCFLWIDQYNAGRLHLCSTEIFFSFLYKFVFYFIFSFID